MSLHLIVKWSLQFLIECKLTDIRIEVGALLQTLSSGKGCPGHVGASVTRYVCLGPFQVCLTIVTITIIAIVTIIIAIITAIVITLITQSKERWRGGKGTAT